MSRAAILTAVGAAVLLCGILLFRHFIRIKTADEEQKTQTVSHTAELYSFVWRQSAENADACFMFSLGTAEEAAGHYLNCVFRTADGKTAEYTEVPIPDSQWNELEAAVRSLNLPLYAPPDPYLMDAADSCAEVCLTDNGNRFTYRYNGEYAHELYSFLLTLIGQIVG